MASRHICKALIAAPSASHITAPHHCRYRCSPSLQMLGNALNPNAGRPAAGNNNAAGALSNLMTPQNMQAAMGAAQRLMGGAGRRLQQSFGTRAGQMATNNLRAQAATSQAIEEAVEAGANPRATRRAGATGSFMSWAAAQNDQRTFDAAERLVYTG